LAQRACNTRWRRMTEERAGSALCPALPNAWRREGRSGQSVAEDDAYE